MDPEGRGDGDCDRYGVAGAHGTIAPQGDEAHYDDRSDASDDVEKGRLKFPTALYGRERELAALLDVHAGIVLGCKSERGPEGAGGSNDADVRDAPYGLFRVVWLGGYSGIGKTALVNEFIKRSQRQYAADSASMIYASGKYLEQRTSSAPFSAVGDMLGRLAAQFCRQKGSEDYDAAWKNIEESDLIGVGKEGGRILLSTFPALSPLFGVSNKTSESSGEKEDDDENKRSSFSEGDDGGNDVHYIGRHTGEEEEEEEKTNDDENDNEEEEKDGCSVDGEEKEKNKNPTSAEEGGETNEDDNENDNKEEEKDDDSDGGEKKEKVKHPTSSVHPSMNAIKECTFELFSCICRALKLPLIICLDDLQWGDAASFDMLRFLLSSKGLSNIMFICSFRSNEVHDDHPFSEVMESVRSARDCNSDSVTKMDLFSLSPETITEFIADSVKKEDVVGEVAELAEAVYKKTMGNIFFVMQALEELVRKNILFYDLMCFEWRWVVSKVEIADNLSEDVVESVKGKLRELPGSIQNLLVVMSHIPNPLDVDTIKALMSWGEQRYDVSAVRGLLEKASKEGMLLRSAETGLYVFAHDRIRQASLEVGVEIERDDMLLHISQVLLDSAEGRDMEWCLFVAVDLLESLPPEMRMDACSLAELELRVSRIAGKRGSMERANELLRRSLGHLESSGMLWMEYTLSLEVYNAIVQTEFNLGSYDKAAAAIAQVLKNAKSNADKLLAYTYQLECQQALTKNYCQVVKDGCQTLNIYGFKIPTSITKGYMVKEEAKLKVALRNGSYSCLLKLQMNDKESIFRLCLRVSKYALFSGQSDVGKIVSWKAIQFGIKYGMDRFFPSIIMCVAISLAMSGKIKMANEVGNVALALSERICHDIENYALIQYLVPTFVMNLLQPFRNSLNPALQAHKDLKMVGDPENASGALMVYFIVYLASGMELGPLLESRLVLAEEYARSVDRAGFLTTYQIFRQFALNLRVRSENPTEFCGDAFHEEGALSEMDVNARKMALRDSSSFRLQLAFIFNDEEGMVSLLETLKEYPLSDMDPSRLHARLCFTGLASFALIQNDNYSYVKLGAQCMNYFERLTKSGSVNAKPVFLFLQAMKSPSREAFATAIDACAEATFIHLEAMARERCAMFLIKNKEAEVGNDYLASSFWLYRDWGADFKALCLSQKHEFLKKSKRNDSKATSATGSAHSSPSTDGKHINLFNSTFSSRQLIKRRWSSWARSDRPGPRRGHRSTFAGPVYEPHEEQMK